MRALPFSLLFVTDSGSRYLFWRYRGLFGFLFLLTAVGFGFAVCFWFLPTAGVFGLNRRFWFPRRGAQRIGEKEDSRNLPPPAVVCSAITSHLLYHCASCIALYLQTPKKTSSQNRSAHCTEPGFYGILYPDNHNTSI